MVLLQLGILLALLSHSLSTDSDFSKQETLKRLNNIRFNLIPADSTKYEVRSDVQDDVDSRLWGGVNLRKAAGRIGDRLGALANDELGVDSLQGVFDSASYASEAQDLLSKVSKIGSRISSKISAYSQVLMANKALIQSLYKFHRRSPISQSLSCCQLNSSLLGALSEGDGEGRGVPVTSMQTVCDLLPHNLNKEMFNPGRNLTSKFSQNIQRYPALKWQYFLSADGVHNEYPAHRMKNTGVQCSLANGYRHREVYVNTLSTQPKNLVILVDTSSVLSLNQMNSAKEVAKQALLSLSTSDKVTVLALSDTVKVPSTLCDAHSLGAATDITKYYLSEYIDELTQANLPANHSLGLQSAFSVIPDGEAGIVLYVSKGTLNSITEPKEVLTRISEGNQRHDGRVVIHTYGLVDDDDVIMYERTFLNDISLQNFTKYGVSYSGPAVTVGAYHTVGSEGDAAAALNDLFVLKAINGTVQSQVPRLSQPYNDLVDKGIVISMTVPCVSVEDDSLIGVVGLDITLEDLTDRVTHTNQQGIYAFLIDRQGYVIMHPSIERVMIDRSTLSMINIEHYENLAGFKAISQKILSMLNGTAELQVINENFGGGSVMNHYNITYVYSWCDVQDTPYKVVMRGMKSYDPRHEILSLSASDASGLVYHRLDLGQLPADETCLHFLQLASFSTSALFLSAKAFEKPYEHASQPETRKMVSNYLAYIRDSSSYISKPGLKEGVKNDVLAVSRIDRLWLEQWRNSNADQYIIRRYVATPTGTLRMFPATLTRKLYDPTNSHWYKQAARLPGRITLTRPYLDTTGAGYIVTLSHSVYEGRYAALHTPRDPIAAVIGADFPYTYYQKLLLDVIPTCELSAIRCFILDDKGYIITHPNFQPARYRRILEHQHLTHVEPLVANDILGHKSLVSKKQCNSFTDRTVQRYYQFNTSLAVTLTNLKAGEQCIRYQMSIIPGTNAFVVMVNETCSQRMSAFCPCSITDRLCLNCQRMEQSECECPCECPLTSDTCTGDLDPKELSHPSCDLFTHSSVLFKLPRAITSRLAQCVEPQCTDFASKRACLGVVGCSWCEFDGTGQTPLDKSFCGLLQVCFGGVLGARTPYNNEISSSSANDSPHTLLKNTPVGPVTGAILGVVLIVVIGVYCYRHNIHRRSLSGPDLQDTSHCSGGYNQDTDVYIYHELPVVPGPSGAAAAAHMNMAEMEMPAHISPYLVNENYIPPRPVVTATDSSDHGYSTMTAQEELETASATSCRESVKSSKSKHSLPSIKLIPSRSKRGTSRLKMDDNECRQLLPADNITSVLPQTIAEQPECEHMAIAT